MASAPSASSSASWLSCGLSLIRPAQPPTLKPSSPAGSWMTPSSVTFSLTTILPMSASFRSTKLAEALRYRVRVSQLRRRAFAQEFVHRCGQGVPQRAGFEHSDVRILETGERLRGQVVVAARLHRRHTLAEAGEREGMVAHGADVMLGLPEASALDARARVKGVDDAPPEEVLCDRWRRELRLSRRIA